MYVATPPDIAAKFYHIGLKLSHVAVEYYICPSPRTVAGYRSLLLTDLAHTAPDEIRLLYQIYATWISQPIYSRHWRYYPKSGAFNCTSRMRNPVSAREKTLALELLSAVI